MHNSLRKQIQECWKNQAPIFDADCRLGETFDYITQANCDRGIIIECLDDLDEYFFVQTEDVPENIMLYLIKCILEINKTVKKVLSGFADISR